MRKRVRRRSSAIAVLAIVAVLMMGAGTAKAYSASTSIRHPAAAATPAAAPLLPAPAVTPIVATPGGILTVLGKGCKSAPPFTQVNLVLFKSTGPFVAFAAAAPTSTGSWKATLTVPKSTSPGAYNLDSSCDQYTSAEAYQAVRVFVVPTATYHALSPRSLFDTRLGSGGVPKAPVAAGHPITVKVAGRAGVPANATAVALNITAVGATTAATAVTVWPAGLTPPFVPTLYAVRLAPVSEFDIVSLHNGSIEFSNSTGKINLAAAVVGYSPGSARFIREKAPVSLFDTRLGSGGVPRAPVAAGHSITVKVAGRAGVPANATAVALNITAVGASAATAVTVWPAGLARPVIPTLYAVRVAPTSQFDIVLLHNGSVEFFNAAGKVNLAAAVVGYSH